jgi:hypothetical protein
LNFNRVCLDCFAKTVSFPLLGKGDIVVATAKGNPFAEAFLSHLEGSEVAVAVELAYVPVACEFVDVFGDIPGLPPKRDLDFCIELIPGTSPIHKSPYRMALVEAEELRRQIDELLGQGFIRRFHSPWGAPVLFVTKKDGSGLY